MYGAQPQMKQFRSQSIKLTELGGCVGIQDLLLELLRRMVKLWNTMVRNSTPRKHSETTILSPQKLG